MDKNEIRERKLLELIKNNSEELKIYIKSYHDDEDFVLNSIELIERKWVTYGKIISMWYAYIEYSEDEFNNFSYCSDVYQEYNWDYDAYVDFQEESSYFEAEKFIQEYELEKFLNKAIRNN